MAVRKRLTWLLWLAAAGAVGFLCSGFSQARQQGEKKVDAPGKPGARKPAPKVAAAIQDLLERLLQENPEELKALHEELARSRQQALAVVRLRTELLRRMLNMRQGGLPGVVQGPRLRLVGPKPAPNRTPLSRLGARMNAPAEVLIDQLDLPKGQGLVVEDPGMDSPASKAGLRKHDILLELGGKPVPSDPAGLAKLEATIKANTPIEMAVLRRGVKQRIRGLTLPPAAGTAKPPARAVDRDF